VIGSMLLAGLQGLAKSLGERLVSAPKQAVALKELTDEVKELRVEHYKNQAAVAELMRQFERIISQTDGLALAGSTVQFSRTETSPTLGDALLSLEHRIAEFRDPEPVSGQPANQQTTQRPARSASVLDGLDEEIRMKRESGSQDT
jgi:hypothetical protein